MDPLRRAYTGSRLSPIEAAVSSSPSPSLIEVCPAEWKLDDTTTRRCASWPCCQVTVCTERRPYYLCPCGHPSVTETVSKCRGIYDVQPQCSVGTGAIVEFVRYNKGTKCSFRLRHVLDPMKPRNRLRGNPLLICAHEMDIRCNNASICVSPIRSLSNLSRHIIHREWTMFMIWGTIRKQTSRLHVAY